jgi:hypothetical protein
MVTHLTGVLVRGACFGLAGARAFSERAVSEAFPIFRTYRGGSDQKRPK